LKLCKTVAGVAFVAASLMAAGGIPASVLAQAPDYLHTQGSQIVDSAGRQVILTGINWFGLETDSYAPHGLWARNWESLLDQIDALGFNTLRLPYSNQLFAPGSTPNGINYDLNPELHGLSGLEIMDKIIAGAGARGLKVILDRHRPDSQAQSDLWYTAQYGEERWIRDWVMLAERYASNDTVIGVDLHNEPHGRATWGSGDPATDWRLAAERAGNAVLEANPDVLIIVQGVDQYQGDWYWWGGNLMGARDYPVRLNVPNRLVYSTHDYGPGVYPQPWFWDASFPDNLPAIWGRHWGYLQREGIAPVIVGEFGGVSVGQDREGIWQRALVSYLRENNLSYFYWTLNPNSADTGGILLDDWQSVDADKLALLSSYQFPLLGIEEHGAGSAALPAPPVGYPPGALRVKYRTANVAADTHDSKPEFVIVNTGLWPAPLASMELRYWFTDDSQPLLDFHCDWAAVGCANLSGDFGFADGGIGYLHLNFRPGAGWLGAGEDSGEIKVRFNRADWAQYRQSDDHSFGPVTTDTEWERVTLYVDGLLVWGVEPGTASSAVGLPEVLAPADTASPILSPPTQEKPPGSTAAPAASGQDAARPAVTAAAAPQPGPASQEPVYLGLVFGGGLALGLGLGLLALRAALGSKNLGG